ncbi:MAG: helix-turn-helix transcriptional regulator [Clostridia bacterium]
MTNFGERLKELMLENNLTTIKLGESVGVTSSNVSKWYLRSADVSLSTLIKLSEYFDCSIEFLSGRLEIDSIKTKNSDEAFLPHIKKIMEENKISEYRLTKDLNLSRNVFQQWRKGSQPRLSSLAKIADYLNCSIDYLVGRE